MGCKVHPGKHRYRPRCSRLQWCSRVTESVRPQGWFNSPSPRRQSPLLPFPLPQRECPPPPHLQLWFCVFISLKSALLPVPCKRPSHSRSAASTTPRNTAPVARLIHEVGDSLCVHVVPGVKVIGLLESRSIDASGPNAFYDDNGDGQRYSSKYTIHR